MARRLLIPRDCYEGMVAQAAAERPNECVGLLLGTPDGRVLARRPLVNALASPCRFEAEPRGLFLAEKERRARGWEYLAVYHSHPAGPCAPSRLDRERRFADDVACVIIVPGPPAEVRAFYLTDDRAVEAEWALEPAAPAEADPEKLDQRLPFSRGGA